MRQCVRISQRRWATPVPQAKDLADLNAYFRGRCLADRDRTSGENTETIGQRFERDRQKALPLPQTAFDGYRRVKGTHIGA